IGRDRPFVLQSGIQQYDITIVSRRPGIPPRRPQRRFGGLHPATWRHITPRMEELWGWVVVPLAVAGGTVWLGGQVRDWLQQRAILDRPVERSSHTRPVPRGGGLALVPLVLVAWLILALAGLAPPGTPAIVAIAAALAALSWRDDIGG